MRVVFMGTPSLSATILEALAQWHDVVGAITRPDAVRGRGNKTIASPVKQVAERLGIPVYEMAALRDDESHKVIADLNPDVICVVAYGVILPREIIDMPRFGCVNVHTSLLPRWRGAAPIERAILEGDDVTGVCVMNIEEGLDTGDYCRRREVPVGKLYLHELADKLARAGAEELIEALVEIQDGYATWVPQDDDGVTYAAKIGKGELSLDIDDSARKAAAKVRASSAAHPARVEVAQRTMAVERADVVEDETGLQLCADMEAGEARFAQKRLLLKMSEGALELLQVRPDGKKSMDARSFAGGIQGIKSMQLTWGRA